MIRKIALIILIYCFKQFTFAQDSTFLCKIELVKPIKKSKYHTECNQLFGHEKYLIQSVYYGDSIVQVALFCSTLNSKYKKGVKKGEYTMLLKKSKKEDLFDESLMGIEVYKYIPYVIEDINIKSRKKHRKRKNNK